MKTALITGITGQDGSYLAELLLSKGYAVHGVVMPYQLENVKRELWQIKNILEQLTLHPGSIESYPSILSIIQTCQPDECYHLAAVSFVSYDFNDSFSTINININGTFNVISSLQKAAPNCRFYFAGSSELFGSAKNSPQNENTPFHPRSIYGITKAAGYYLTMNYRERFDMFACNGILYNHESPRRGAEYVTRKITIGAANIKSGLQKKLSLGNLDAVRDWGFAQDYVQAMWQMLQQDKPEDFIIATGETHSVREFCEVAFSHLDLDYKKYVMVNENFFRKGEDVPLVGNAAYARKKLCWKPSITFQELVEMMVDSDYQQIQKRN